MEHINHEKIRSPLRYPGGKSRAVAKILPLIPESFAEYREPFLGGASVFTAVRQKHPKKIFRVNDLNFDVFSFWKTLQEKPAELTKAVLAIKERCKDGKHLHSILIRSETKGIFGRALRYYILNRISYSGIVDSGGYSAESFEKRFTLSKIKNIAPISALLKNVKITNESYERLLFREGKDVFIFLDPPYWTQRKSPLYGKSGNLNKFFDHEQFAENVKKCKHKWLITCDDSDFIRELFSFAHVYPWEMKYNGMHKKKAVNGKELFITNIKLDFQQSSNAKTEKIVTETI